MDKIIFIVLIIIIIILIINVYEEYVTIKILLNKVRDLDRELSALKNKEKIEKLKNAIKDSSISIKVDNGTYYKFKNTKEETQKLYESLMQEYFKGGKNEV